MITSIALSRLTAMETNNHQSTKERNNNESTDSLQKNTNSTTPRRTDVCRRRAGPRHTVVRFYIDQSFRSCAGGLLSIWLAQPDLSRRPDLGAHHKGARRLG